MHAHSGPIYVKDLSKVTNQLNITIREGEGVYFPNILYPLTSSAGLSQSRGHVLATITTEIPFLNLKELAFLPFRDMVKEAGIDIKNGEDLQEVLKKEMELRHPNKKNVNWITFIYFKRRRIIKDAVQKGKMVDDHPHFAEPILMDGDVFLDTEVGSLATALLDSYTIFNSEELSPIHDISQRLLGEGQPILYVRTRIRYLKELNHLPLYQMLNDAGHLSAELTKRHLLMSQGKRGRDIDWVTIVFLKIVRKFYLYHCPSCGSEKLSLESINGEYLLFICSRPGCESKFAEKDRENFLAHPQMMYLTQRYPLLKEGKNG
jgi:hypothetical protein